MHTVIISGLCLLLAGCGFHPMYGDDSAGAHSAVRGNIVIDPMPNTGHEGQIFKTALEDKFNPEGLSSADAQYHLHISLIKTLIPAVVKSDGTIQRYNVRFDSQYKLTRTGDTSGQPLYSGRLLRTGSYNAAINANFATYEAEQDVIQRVLEELAEDYVLRVTSYLEAAPDTALKPAPAPKPKT